MCQTTSKFTHLPRGHASLLAGSEGVLQVSEPVAATALDVDHRPVATAARRDDVNDPRLGPTPHAVSDSPVWGCGAVRAGGWIRAHKGAKFKPIGCRGMGEHGQLGR